MSTHDLKVAADQGNAVAQNNYGRCLHKGECVRMDFRAAAHYFKLAADQENADGQFNLVMGFVCVKVKVLELILKDQHIILNLLLIKDYAVGKSWLGQLHLRSFVSKEGNANPLSGKFPHGKKSIELEILAEKGVHLASGLHPK
jgi:hypothetical protein